MLPSNSDCHLAGLHLTAGLLDSGLLDSHKRMAVRSGGSQPLPKGGCYGPLRTVRGVARLWCRGAKRDQMKNF